MIRTLLLSSIAAAGFITAAVPTNRNLPQADQVSQPTLSHRLEIVLDDARVPTLNLPDVVVVARSESGRGFALTAAAKGADLPDLVVYGAKTVQMKENES